MDKHVNQDDYITYVENKYIKQYETVIMNAIQHHIYN